MSGRNNSLLESIKTYKILIRWMFYTQNIDGETERLIMKSNMDGSEESVLLDVNFYYFISLAVDEWTETVYWLETFSKKLHSVSMYGSNKRVR